MLATIEIESVLQNRLGYILYLAICMTMKIYALDSYLKEVVGVTNMDRRPHHDGLPGKNVLPTVMCF